MVSTSNTTPPTAAAGTKAVVNSVKMALKVMKPWKALTLGKQLNQRGGIDCPGCAWPDPAKRSRLGEFCENGVKAIAEEAMDASADPTFFAKYSVQELMAKSDYWLGQKGRLTHPMILRPGDTHYHTISWKEAFEMIGQKLNALHSPNEAIFYTSGRSSNEAAFLYQLFVRSYGTNNLPDCSNMCHESSGVALGETLGLGKGSVTLEDFPQAEVILIFGQNPGTNHPRMLSALEKAKKNGAKVITINPLKEAGLLHFKNPQTLKGITVGQDITDLYLQIKINQDVPLVKAWLKLLLEEAKTNSNAIDQSFIKTKTEGFEALKADLEKYSLADLISHTGLLEEEVRQAAAWLGKSNRIIACWAMGLTQHQNAVDNIREIVNLLLLKGSIGKPGAGTCPVRGHSNVQGDRTMGIWERPSEAFVNRLATALNIKPPKAAGYNVVEAIEAMHQRQAKVFIALGGNFVAAAPDTEYTYEALQGTDLSVQVSTKLNRSHLVHGKTALILPCLGRTDKHVEASGEQVVTVENSMGVVHTSQGVLTPRATTLLSEPKIVAEIAQASVGNQPVDWLFLVEDYQRIRDLIGKTIPGFENYNERLKDQQGFNLPNGPREGRFTTPDGKAHFTVNQGPRQVLADYELMMMTIRSHDQFNTTVYGLDDRYRGIKGERRIIFMNEKDMQARQISAGSWVDLYSTYEGKRRTANTFRAIAYDIPVGCTATYFPEANPLVPLQLRAHGSHTPASKSIPIRVVPVNT